MEEKIRVLVVDDHPIMRKGLLMIIKMQKDMEVVGEAGSVAEALEVCGETMPDLVLLDLSLPDGTGLDFIKKGKESYPDIKILVLTIHDDEGYLRKVLAAGANGYLLKKAADVELVLAIKAVSRGEVFIDSFMTRDLLQGVMGEEEGKKGESPLSARQKEILKMVALGYTDKQIAEKLFISIKTVESNKARIKEKLNIVERSELVQYALENYFSGGH